MLKKIPFYLIPCFVLILIFLVAPARAQEDKSKYIGYQYPGLLFGEKVLDVEEQGGGLISGLSPNAATMIGISQKKRGTTAMLWLEKSVGRTPKGIPIWQVKDVLFFPNFGANQELQYADNPVCTKDGKPNTRLVVHTEINPKLQTYTLKQAWLANTSTEKFEPIALQGIACQVYVP